MEYILINKKKYDFKDESGKSVKGCKLKCLDVKNFVSSNYDNGYNVVDISAPYETYDLINDLPAKVNVDFSVLPGKKGIPVLSFSSIQFLEKLDFDF